MESFVYVRKVPAMSDIFVDLNRSLKIIYLRAMSGYQIIGQVFSLTINKTWDFSSSFDSSEGGPTPSSSSYLLDDEFTLFLDWEIPPYKLKSEPKHGISTMTL